MLATCGGQDGVTQAEALIWGDPDETWKEIRLNI